MVEDCKCKSCGCGKMTADQMWDMIEDNTLPFTEEIIDERNIVRHFDPTAPDHLFKWHFDEHTRIVEVLNDTDWQFQYDDQMPFQLKQGMEITIPFGEYHRLIKGTKKLSLKINKLL